MEYSEQIRDSLVNQLSRYDFEPTYQISIDTRNSYDVLVNDCLGAYDFGTFKQKRSFSINWAILKSGKQRLRIKLYPEYIDGKLSESLKNKDYLKLEVSYFTWSKDNTGIDETIEVLTYELPKHDVNGNPLDYSQKKELTIDLEFEANVPYELKGWTDGVVFDKKDSVLLKQKLVSMLEENIDDFKNKRFDKIRARFLYHDFEISQSVYKNKELFQKSYDKDKREYSYLPLENYDIFFYGDGRLITLRRIDDIDLGCSPYIRTYKNEMGIWRNQYLNMVFYQPKGSDKFVLIR